MNANATSLPSDPLEQCLHQLLESVTHHHQQRFTEALQCLDAIPEPYCALPPVLAERATVLADLGQFEQSLRTCRTLLAHAPEPEHRQLLNSIKERALSQCLAKESLDAALQRGNIHLLADEFSAAIEQYERILTEFPNHRDALANKGFSLAALQHPEAAAACYARLLTIYPEDALHWFNLGNVLKDMNRFDTARGVYEKAIDLQPDFAEAHLEIALCRFAEGNFSEGWSGYEWRWKTRQLHPHYLPLPSPVWLGKTSLRDRTILLWAEQGLGDTLQFARFVPLVADLAQHVILRADVRLCRLLQSLDPRITIIDTETPIPAHDTHCPLMSLPLALERPLPWIPDAGAYLSPPSVQIDLHADEPGRKTRRRMGLCWAGQQNGQVNPPRDVPFAQLHRLLQLDADFVNLQLNIPADDITDIASHKPLIDPTSGIRDFSDTAAIIAPLDLVISVDSAVAHLAGALGKPCWLMLRYSAEWRWQTERNDSPWYPSFRLFRQPRPGDWGAVVEDVAEALCANALLQSPAKTVSVQE